MNLIVSVLYQNLSYNLISILYEDLCNIDVLNTTIIVFLGNNITNGPSYCKA
jgi:hypothetical protein